MSELVYYAPPSNKTPKRMNRKEYEDYEQRYKHNIFNELSKSRNEQVDLRADVHELRKFYLALPASLQTLDHHNWPEAQVTRTLKRSVPSPMASPGRMVKQQKIQHKAFTKSALPITPTRASFSASESVDTPMGTPLTPASAGAPGPGRYTLTPNKKQTATTSLLVMQRLGVGSPSLNSAEKVKRAMRGGSVEFLGPPKIGSLVGAHRRK